MKQQELIRSILIYNAYDTGMSMPVIKERFECSNEDVYTAIAIHNDHIQNGIPDDVKAIYSNMFSTGTFPIERVAQFYGMTETALKLSVSAVKPIRNEPVKRSPQPSQEVKRAFMEEYMKQPVLLSREELAAKYGVSVSQLNAITLGCFPRGLSPDTAKALSKEYWEQRNSRASLKSLAEKHGISYDTARKWASECRRQAEDSRFIG